NYCTGSNLLPRVGPTLWKIGIPYRTAAEFYVPNPKPNYINEFLINHPERVCLVQDVQIVRIMGKGNNVIRMICMAAFAVSGYACTNGRLANHSMHSW
ncbi:hypothetical protein HN51_004458, partial [Arachis hypogaea]